MSGRNKNILKNQTVWVKRMAPNLEILRKETSNALTHLQFPLSDLFGYYIKKDTLVILTNPPSTIIIVSLPGA